MSLKNLLKKIKGSGLDGVDFSLKVLPADLQFEDDDEALFFQAAFKSAQREKGVFSPSELSVENPICPRKMYFRRARVAHDPGVLNFAEADNRMMRIVDLGTMIHLYIQVNLRRAGMLVEREVKINAPEYGIKGSCDGIADFQGYDTNQRYFAGRLPIEIKTINTNGFAGLKTAKPDHIKQASIYAHFLGYKQTLFIYYNKDNSEIKTYIVDNDNTFLELFLELAHMIVTHYAQETKGTRSKDITKHNLPPRICGSFSCDRATHCPYRNTCFSL